MKDIGKHNYSEFIVDYFDGRLTKVQIEELWNFLRYNPDIENEFYTYQEAYGDHNMLHVNEIQQNQIRFNKEVLKKSFEDISEINEGNFNEFCVADLEGDLSIQMQSKLYDFMKENSLKERDYNIIKSTFLKPDYSINFSRKRSLKKNYSIIYSYRKVAIYASVAAAIVGGLLVLNPFQSEIEKVNRGISQVQTSNNTEKNIDNEIVQSKKSIELEENLKSKQASKYINYKRETTTNFSDSLNNEDLRVNKKTENLEYLSGISITSIPNNEGDKEIQDLPIKETLLSIIPVDRSVLEKLNNQSPSNDSATNYLNESTLLSAAKFTVDNVSKALGKNNRLEYKVNDEGRLIAFGYGNMGYSTTRGQK